jgi:sedoheptulose-bisphosphatase
MGEASGTHINLQAHLNSSLPSERQALGNNIIPTLLGSIGHISTILRDAHSVSQVGSSNAFGDEQLNVDVLCEKAVRDALAQCPCIVTASSEEDPIETPVRYKGASDAPQGPSRGSGETYTVAFDPLDGSSIIAANWTIGTIIGIWDGSSALHQNPRKRQVAAILGVCGPRATAIVAIRLPGQEGICFEVAISGLPDEAREAAAMYVSNVGLEFSPSRSIKTRYFAPANLRVAASDPKYLALINHYIKEQYTLRYSGGLVPDVVHMLIKGHGVFINPVSNGSKPKLRKLYELFPVALVIECTGGKAVNADDGKPVLDQQVADVEERGGLFCGTTEEVDFVIDALLYDRLKP